MEPHSDYHADNSHSDLSDILEEEEEEDLYSDHLGEAKARGYTVGANRVKKIERTTDCAAICTHICTDTELF